MAKFCSWHVGGGIWASVYKRILPSSSLASLTAQEPFLPMWCQNYDGFTLVSCAEPVDIDINGSTMLRPIRYRGRTFQGWNQGMEGLQNLAQRLNELDERKGKYLTGSELQSMVFTITQNFRRSVPVEEQLS